MNDATRMPVLVYFINMDAVTAAAIGWPVLAGHQAGAGPGPVCVPRVTARTDAGTLGRLQVGV
jgi:hypothetical protein